MTSNDQSNDLLPNFEQFKAAASKIAEESTCPLSLQLMVDPVTAEDGHCFEREFIEKVILNSGDNLRSPKTNNPMGPVLSNAVSVRNIIESLIESGAIDSELVTDCKQRKLVFETTKEANKGNAEAMCDLGDFHFHGTHGFAEDFKLAFYWHKLSADLGHVRGLANAAWSYLHGAGVEESAERSKFFYSLAAGKGSDVACYQKTKMKPNAG